MVDLGLIHSIPSGPLCTAGCAPPSKKREDITSFIDVYSTFFICLVIAYAGPLPSSTVKYNPGGAQAQENMCNARDQTQVNSG